MTLYMTDGTHSLQIASQLLTFLAAHYITPD